MPSPPRSTPSSSTMAGASIRWLRISLLLLLLLVFLDHHQVAAQSNSYNQNTVQCNTGFSIEAGYDSLQAIQTDMDAERDRIINGINEEPASSYQFVLCAQTEFVVTTPLRPSLDNAQLLCGLPPRLGNNCVLTGHDIQVEVSQDWDDYPVTETSFVGVTFSQFTQAAIAGTASDAVRVLVVNSQFSDFSSSFIISQQQANSNGANPFRVEVRTATVANGQAHIGFYVVGGSSATADNNDNDVLLLQDLDMGNLDMTGSLLSVTGSVSASFEDSELKFGDMTNIVSAQGGGNVNMTNVKVSNMKRISIVAQATGPGTTATLQQLKIQNNLNSNQQSWQYVEVNERAHILVSDSQFRQNENVRYGFHANALGTLDLRDVQATDNAGALEGVATDLVSVIVLAIEDSTVNIYDSEFSNTNGITSAFFSFADSNIVVKRTCLSELSTEGALLFAQFGSTLSMSEHNAIVNAAVLDEPLLCPEGASRLVEENRGDSTCFKDGVRTKTGNGCKYECNVGGTYNDCSLIPDKSQTAAPTTMTPTTSPMPTTVPTAGASHQLCMFGGGWVLAMPLAMAVLCIAY